MKLKLSILILLFSIFLVSCSAPTKKDALESYTNSLKNYQETTNGNYRVEITYITNKLVEKQIYIMTKTENSYKTTINIQNYENSSTTRLIYELKNNNLYQNDLLLEENYSESNFIENYTMPLYITFDKSLSDYTFSYSKIQNNGYSYTHTYQEQGCVLQLLGETIRDIEEKIIANNNTLISYDVTMYNYNDKMITYKSNYIQ